MRGLTSPIRAFSVLRRSVSLEESAARVCAYLQSAANCSAWRLANCDATGRQGDQLAAATEKEGGISVAATVLLDALREEGQFLELDAESVTPTGNAARLVIRDGASLDVLVCGIELPAEVLGTYEEADPNQFCWKPGT